MRRAGSGRTAQARAQQLRVYAPDFYQRCQGRGSCWQRVLRGRCGRPCHGSVSKWAQLGGLGPGGRTCRPEWPMLGFAFLGNPFLGTSHRLKLLFGEFVKRTWLVHVKGQSALSQTTGTLQRLGLLNRWRSPRTCSCRLCRAHSGGFGRIWSRTVYSLGCTPELILDFLAYLSDSFS